LYALPKAFKPPTKCCASPTTCNVDSATGFRVGAAFEAMLLAPVLRPILPAADAIGEYGLDLLAREIAAHDRDGFASVIADQLENRP
jgi:hypothetical protein